MATDTLMTSMAGILPMHPNLQAEGDYIEGDKEPIDESGHGTHVAGIAGRDA